MKGLILSGGTGSRLYPLTQVVNKQLLPVYDKPMIYYPMSTLISRGIRDICIISSSEYIESYKWLFRHSNYLGLNIVYEIQEKPEGIAQSFLIAENFIKGEDVALILGDNIFHGLKAGDMKQNGATVLAYEVSNPSDYGVVEFDKVGKVISLEEKPVSPKSRYAIPGLYFYDSSVLDIAKTLKPSKRGELEITELNAIYLRLGGLSVIKPPKGFVWLDAGTPQTLRQASSYVQTVQDRQGVWIGCIEEECLKSGFLTRDNFKILINVIPFSSYRDYLVRLLEEND